MNIFEFALEFEKESEQFYRDLAANCETPGLKNILILLAEDEVKHYHTISAMRNGGLPEMAPTQVLPSARDLFAAMKDDLDQISPGADEIELYRAALGKEDQAEQFYREQAADSSDPQGAALLLRLADEERRHRFLIENIIEFLSRPKTWVEDAEFNHLEEY
ncbi:MAG: ferritin family protein [Acidobacteriota bacterium]|jgi:rubrerythrin|nr:ferritin family protein [Acidobacteriota bacterium]